MGTLDLDCLQCVLAWLLGLDGEFCLGATTARSTRRVPSARRCRRAGGVRRAPSAWRGGSLGPRAGRARTGGSRCAWWPTSGFWLARAGWPFSSAQPSAAASGASAGSGPTGRHSRCSTTTSAGSTTWNAPQQAARPGQPHTESGCRQSMDTSCLVPARQTTTSTAPKSKLSTLRKKKKKKKKKTPPPKKKKKKKKKK